MMERVGMMADREGDGEVLNLRSIRRDGKIMNALGQVGPAESEYMRRHHCHSPRDHQCSSALLHRIKAPIHIVWSLVRRFDQPQKYKPFVRRCEVVQGDLRIGSIRQVNVMSGLPATTSTERLELLDEDEHLFGISILGGDHRLKNYSSITSLHPESVEGKQETLVIESFVVDVPDGNTNDETCVFVEHLINCNLGSLKRTSEDLLMRESN